MKELNNKGDGEGSVESKLAPTTSQCGARTEEEKNRLASVAARAAAKNIQGSLIVGSLWLGWLTMLIAFVGYYRWYALAWFWKSIGYGAVLGFFGTAVYHQNQKWKDEKNQRLGMVPGKKGTQYLLHQIPMWLNFSSTEKMEWLNQVIEQAWPYYDKAICDEIKRQVEPMINEYKPPFIKKISFQKLTFGDSPFRVEGIRVYDQQQLNDRVEMEIAFRWSGDASIFLAIELVAGGKATRMVPKVTDLAVSGQAKITLCPLVPDIPGFGAATVALMRPPQVKFHLDFGKAFGGSLSAKAVVAWLDPFLRETFTSLLVWPRRIVVPILPEETTGPLSDLYMRNKGAIEMVVKSGKNIPAMDNFGSCDPFLEMFVDPNGDRERTSKKSNTLEPVWEERHWLLVQEPRDQYLHLKLFDVDMINVKELFRLNVIKGATSILGAEDLVGRARVHLAGVSQKPGEVVNMDIDLGMDEFSNPSGCGSGRGQISMSVTYWPLEQITGHASEPIGALLVTLISVSNAPISDIILGTSDVYVSFSCAKITKKSAIMYRDCSPEFDGNSKFEWFKIDQRGSTLSVDVYDYDRIGSDDLLGRVSIPLKEISHAPKGDVTKSWELQVLPNLSCPDPSSPSTITMRIQWVPFKDITR